MNTHFDAKQPTVYSARSGLSNRLRALVGCIAAAELHGNELLIHWPLQGACNIEFERLFDIERFGHARLIGATEAERFKLVRPANFIHSAESFTELWHGFGLDDDCYADYCRRAIAALRTLGLAADVRDAIEHFAATHRLRECIGVHIRMTDNVNAYAVWKASNPDFSEARVSTLEGFLDVIADASRNGRRVFLATDNDAIAADIMHRHPHVIQYEKLYDNSGLTRHVQEHYGGRKGLLTRLFGRRAGSSAAASSWRTTSIIDAVIDLWLLGCCESVVGTYYSSFSQVGALIGGVPLSIVEGRAVVPDPEVDRLYSLSVRT